MTDGRTDGQTDQRTEGPTDIHSYEDVKKHLKITHDGGQKIEDLSYERIQYALSQTKNTMKHKTAAKREFRRLGVTSK